MASFTQEHLDAKVEPALPVDFIITFKRMTGKFETTIKVPAGYRDGNIWLAGIKEK